MSIPNCKHIVEDLAAKFPQEWWSAHRPSGGGPETEAFIRRLAWVLHSTVDPRFGLVGKRGNPDDISDDAICFDGFSALGDVDPTRGNVPVTVLDVIGGAGGPNPTPQWGPAGPATPRPHAAWVKPVPVGDSSSGGGGTPLPAPPPTPPAPDLSAITKRLDALLTAISEIKAELAVVRASVDAAHSEASTAAHESTQAAIRASDIKKQIANLPASSAPTFPPYEGSFFGRRVRLEPK
jgi:hypothetical protein